MRRAAPLLDHPELVLIECPAWREYRVYNPRSLRRPSTLQAFLNLYWLDAAVTLVVALLWPLAAATTFASVMVVVAWALYVYFRCTEILWESVIVLPSLGLQFETYRGFSPIPLFTSRKFIPLSALEDFIINEGLQGWNIRYYLAAIQRSQAGIITLQVAFENLLPFFPVLMEVYHGIHESFDRSMTNSDTSA